MLLDGVKSRAAFSFYSNSEVDGMIQKIAGMSDPKERETAIQQTMKMVHDDAAWLYLGPIDTIFAARKQLKGYGVPIEYLSLAKAEKTEK